MALNSYSRATLNLDDSLTASRLTQGPWPLTEAQEGLWYAQKISNNVDVLNVAHAIWINGPLCINDFQRAADHVASGIEALSISIVNLHDKPVQTIDLTNIPWLSICDLRIHNESSETVARSHMSYDLNSPDSVHVKSRQTLFLLDDFRFVWYLRTKHLNVDGYGMALWIASTLEAYANLRSSISGELKGFSSYQTSIIEDQIYRASLKRQQDKLYWASLRTAIDGSTNVAGPSLENKDLLKASFSIPEKLWELVKSRASELKIGWPDYLVALSSLYLRQHFSLDAIVVGIPCANRLGSPLSDIPCTAVNVIPILANPSAVDTIATFCNNFSAAMIAGKKHSKYRGEQIRRDLGLIGGSKRLYSARINIQPRFTKVSLPELNLREEILATGPNDVLTFGFRVCFNGGLNFEIDCFASDDVKPELHFQRIMEFFEKAQHDTSALALSIASKEEQQQHIYRANATTKTLPHESLQVMLELAFRNYTDLVALEYGSTTQTFAELDRLSLSLAEKLCSLGAGPETLIGIGASRSLEMAVFYVAIARAGAAFLPLDLSQPSSRLQTVLLQARPLLVLVDSDQKQILAGLYRTLCLSDLENWTSEKNLQTAKGTNLAYVIYTSGSTGHPKGVMVENQAIVNRLEWMRSIFNMKEGERYLHKTPITFDVSVWEIFLPLVTGGTLVIAPPDLHREPDRVATMLRTAHIDNCHFVPSMLAAFLATPMASGLQIKRVFCSGEDLRPHLRDEVHRVIDCELYNLYGPTEAAVDVSYWHASKYDETCPVPIGHAVWNTQLYVLDDTLNACAQNCPGELFIGGIQVGRGYIGSEKLTNERFIANPFHIGKMYKTGDICYWREDGSIVFLGRNDRQIKLRGQRIELHEIETAIFNTGLVRHVEVLVDQRTNGAQRIAAYFQPIQPIEEIALRDVVCKELPAYMIPSVFVSLAEWPITNNGKLDKNFLSKLDLATPVRLSSLDTNTEKKIANIFCKVLSLSDIELDKEDDFFTLGGDSLSATEVILEIEKIWQIRPELSVIFEMPTIRELAVAIDNGVTYSDAPFNTIINLHSCSNATDLAVYIHPAGGLAWCYQVLAKKVSESIRSNKSVHPATSMAAIGIQCPLLNEDGDLTDSLSELADEYARMIQGYNATRVHIIGWSVGGIIAHEVAVCLSEKGLSVESVTLIDAYPADVWRDEAPPSNEDALRAIFAMAGVETTVRPELTNIEEALAVIHDNSNVFRQLSIDTLRGVVRSVVGTNKLVRTHHHRRYKGSITHIRAAADHVNKPHLSASTWRHYCDDLQEKAVPFKHVEMVKVAASIRIAEIISTLNFNIPST